MTLTPYCYSDTVDFDSHYHAMAHFDMSMKVSRAAELELPRLESEGGLLSLMRTNWQAWLSLFAITAFTLLPWSREMTLGALADAYWQVASYVACTLFVVYAFQTRFSASSQVSKWLNASPSLQVFFASAAGILPGCGGAIVVMTQFVKGKLSFGSVVAVLTATMGDAAFLLLATAPSAGAQVLGISLVAAIISGFVVDRVHRADFLRPDVSKNLATSVEMSDTPMAVPRPSYQARFWQVVMLPTVCIALLGSMQYDVDAVFGAPPGSFTYLGAGLSVIAMMLWATGDKRKYDDCARSIHRLDGEGLFHLVAHETHFILSWVILGFLSVQILMLASGYELTALLPDNPGLLVLGAIMVGWIPGCGPQIILTSLYLQGQLPFSAQLGNAISNDGDALFPALALAPKAALVATLYSTVPALISAYGYGFIFGW